MSHPMKGFRGSPRLYVVVAGVLGLLLTPVSVLAQGATVPVIVAPTDGQVLQGQVQVRGTTDVPNFVSAEVAFGYASDPTHTWFTIQTDSLPRTNDVITAWDTTTITDGDYVLRLRVNLSDGSTQDATVSVRILNYTPLPTPSPAATATEPPVVEVPTAIVIAPSDTPTAQPPPVPATPTALPPNPAGVTPGEIFSRFWRGALLVGALVVVFAAIVRLRR
jgi:hypothetical protein